MPVMCKKSDFRLTTLTRPSSCSSTNGALQAANNFTSEYPSFKLVVRSYHWKHCNVTIPCRFFRRYIEHKAENAILQVADRVWPVQFKPAPRCHSVALSVGWRAFATANSLEAGDVCIFELIKSKVLKSVSKKAKLYIFRDGSELANNLITENPSFHFVVKSYHLEKGNVYVPNSFMKELMEITETESILLQVADKVKGIPRKFMRQYGNGLLSPVILNVPSGAKWRVELLNCNGDVWLGKGWRDFSNYYSLDHGNFLVFKYEGDCQFRVLIFDKSTLEIEYPCNNFYNAKPNHGELHDTKIEENEDDTSVEALDVLSQCKKMGEKSTFLRRSWKFTQSRCKKNDNGKVRRPHSCSRTSSQALEAANKAKYPSFQVVVKPYHWDHSNVPMPAPFFRSYFECKTQRIMLQIADRFWSVNLISPSGSCTATLSAGWHAFARENAIEVGHVCVFELIKRNVLNMVPKKFVRQHGNCLSSPVITLEVPSGAKWEVERLNNEGEIWLGEGWKEFAQHHSLEQDYVIFFKHVEDCHFDVIICDESGLEIEYPDHDSDVVEVIELDMEEEKKSKNKNKNKMAFNWCMKIVMASKL
ncbi:hypothetical protein GH714_010210 [Hevea brasiliensis]|uniref:TF-B3 domain-containing protein n=1 Tax=Hevea brasiliensis TaxID=3981 RepID=A0A6A6N1H5_HEVBR|nr:hypothetical protein GH714_010210 [Hevea brasiliensis]